MSQGDALPAGRAGAARNPPAQVLIIRRIVEIVPLASILIAKNR